MRGSVLKASMHISCQVKKIELVLIVLDLEYGGLRGPDLLKSGIITPKNAFDVLEFDFMVTGWGVAVGTS